MHIYAAGQAASVAEVVQGEQPVASARVQLAVVGLGPVAATPADTGLAAPTGGVSAARPAVIRVAADNQDAALLEEARAHFVRDRPEVVATLRRVYPDLATAVIDEVADQWVARSLRRYRGFLEGRNDGLQDLTPSPPGPMRETASMECPINHDHPPQYYGDYLGIERLLELQKPLSLREGKLIAHDEMLFIIIHQAYELWFKQILHEITACKEVLSKPAADDDGPDMNVVVHRLKRVVEIWKLLNHQVDVLETMTPLDFLEFRELLHGASGFQSIQFRKIEASLGLEMENRFRPEYYKHTQFGGFDEKDFAEISEFEAQPSLLQLVENWLERMPFFEKAFWQDWEGAPNESTSSEYAPFWEHYRVLYEQSLSDRDEKSDLLGKFDDIFFKAGWGAFRPTALRAALFIMLYRDEPLFRLPFALLNSLIEIDEQLANFRYRHLQMVRRMIGSRVGTGGSSGEQYLQGAVNKNYIFKELAGIITFLIERCRLPALPPRLHQALRFSFANR